MKSLPPRSSAGHEGGQRSHLSANITSLDPIKENYKLESQSEVDPDSSHLLERK